ncbi:hypothetical protein SPHFLASMR4Y_03193 [Sphingorhabdus sp. SMR4y]|nr:hypothetical protein SPHFLASMR4Y_03193 [Sphingorhabdus sp. SMR4y]
MVNHEFEILLSLAAIVIGIGMLWMARSQPD